MKTAILFDHDGVLVDTERLYFRANELTYADAGLVLDPVQYLDDMTHQEGSWLQARAAGVTGAGIQEMRVARNQHYQDLLHTEPIEIPGVVEVLETLAPHVRMGIVSSCKRRDFEVIHKDAKITSFMEFALLREDIVRSKPDPEPYRTGLARLGCEPSEVLVVEDSAKGLRSALAAGIECAVVAHPFTAGQDLTGARWHLASLADLPGLVLDGTA